MIDRIEDSPVKRMLDAGLLVTINSDDPAYFGGYVNANYEAIAAALDLSAAEIVQLAKNSFTGSFLPERNKADRIADIEAVA